MQAEHEDAGRAAIAGGGCGLGCGGGLWHGRGWLLHAGSAVVARHGKLLSDGAGSLNLRLTARPRSRAGCAGTTRSRAAPPAARPRSIVRAPASPAAVRTAPPRGTASAYAGNSSATGNQ